MFCQGEQWLGEEQQHEFIRGSFRRDFDKRQRKGESLETIEKVKITVCEEVED